MLALYYKILKTFLKSLVLCQQFGTNYIILKFVSIIAYTNRVFNLVRNFITKSLSELSFEL